MEEDLCHNIGKCETCVEEEKHDKFVPKTLEIVKHNKFCLVGYPELLQSVMTTYSYMASDYLIV